MALLLSSFVQTTKTHKDVTILDSFNCSPPHKASSDTECTILVQYLVNSIACHIGLLRQKTCSVNSG